MDFSTGSIKEEYAGSSSSQYYWDNEELIPRPLEALLETGPPPFLSKTYDFVEDPSTNELVSWSQGNNSFIVWDPQTFAMHVLPKYFKHNNFSSFVRQLNTYVLSLGRRPCSTASCISNSKKKKKKIISMYQYLFSTAHINFKSECPRCLEYSSNPAFYTKKGFRKVDPDKWEFANEGFLRGHRHLLKNIVRRKTHYSSSQTSINQSLGSCAEVKNYGLDAEIDCLRCDKGFLATELAKRRQQQQTTLSWIRTMKHRLEGAERKQKQTVSLLAKAIQNPTFLHPKSQQKNEKNELEDLVSSKRRRGILDHVSRNVGVDDLVFEEGENADLSMIGNVGFRKVGRGSLGNTHKNDVGIRQFGDGTFYVKLEPQEYGEIPRFGGSELEKLPLSMQKPQVIMDGKSLENEGFKSTDEGFWEELINQGIDEIGTLGDEEDGDDLAEQLELILGSNSR